MKRKQKLALIILVFLVVGFRAAAAGSAENEIAIGLHCHDQGQYTNAVLHLSEAIRLSPKNAAAYLHRADSYTFLNDMKRAIADYSKGIELNQKEANGYLSRGEAYTKIDENDKAIADYKTALSLNPKLARAYADLGDVYLNAKKDIAAAKDHYAKALKLDPTDRQTQAALKSISNQPTPELRPVPGR